MGACGCEFTEKREAFSDGAIEPYVMAAGVCATIFPERNAPPNTKANPIERKRAIIVGNVSNFLRKEQEGFLNIQERRA